MPDVAIVAQPNTSGEISIMPADTRATFRKLHDAGCFVLPNPWDVGSAKALQQLGFKALASTSAGFAWTIGKADNREIGRASCRERVSCCV